MSFFDSIPQVTYEGPKSKNPYAFKYYDPERVILGKKMKEIGRASCRERV